MSIALAPQTLGKVLSSVRSMLNQPNAANSNWSDSQLVEWINNGIQRYYGEVVQNVEGQWTKTALLDIVTGVETIDLPSDFFEIKSVWKIVSTGAVILPYLNSISNSYATISGANGTETYFPSYYFREQKLVLRPYPNYSEVGGIRIEYIYFPDTLLNAGDVMSTNIAPIFSELIVMYAVLKAKTQQSLVNGSDMTGVAKANLADLYDQFVKLIKNRSKFPQFIKPFSPESYD